MGRDWRTISCYIPGGDQWAHSSFFLPPSTLFPMSLILKAVQTICWQATSQPPNKYVLHEIGSSFTSTASKKSRPSYSLPTPSLKSSELHRSTDVRNGFSRSENPYTVKFDDVANCCKMLQACCKTPRMLQKQTEATEMESNQISDLKIHQKSKSPNTEPKIENATKFLCNITLNCKLQTRATLQ